MPSDCRSLKHMTKTIENKEQELIDKLEKEKLEEVTIYTVEIGYNKWGTTDKEAAFQLWQSLSDGFFTLESIGDRYEKPQFNWKKPIEVKLVGEKKDVWKDYESAQRAANAFKALSERAVNKAKAK